MEDMDQRIDQRCTVIGMIMEDTSMVALFPEHEAGRSSELCELAIAMEDIATLTKAAVVLKRRTSK